MSPRILLLIGLVTFWTGVVVLGALHALDIIDLNDYQQQITIPQMVEVAAPTVESQFEVESLVIQTRVGVTEEIHTTHTSVEFLDRFKILVNDQPIGPENDGTTFPDRLVQVRALVSGQEVFSNTIVAPFPTHRYTLPLRWTANAPGTYDLQIVALDTTGAASLTATQRIEVR